jgi:integrase
MENQENHPVLGGKAYVFRRDRSNYWYAATFLNGRNYRSSTKEEQLYNALQFAEDWYIAMRGKASAGLLPPPQEAEEPAPQEKTFREVADQFMKEYSVITEGQRSPRWVEGHAIRLRVHLLPFFGDLPISAVSSGKVQEYRVLRMTPRKEKNPHAKDNRPFKSSPPARKTLHNEIVTLRLVLKSAMRHGWLMGLPDLSPPFRKQGKVSHRPWFSPAEYKQLYTATREYAKTAPPHIKWSAEQVHDFVLFMANTGLRPDEAMNLQHRDVEIVHDEDTDETILLIEVRGKRGVGYCKSTANAVTPYKRLLNRPKPSFLNEEGEDTEAEHDKKPKRPQPEDHVFPSNHVKLFNRLLLRKKLKFDRDNQARTAYSLRHTYICLRLTEGADIYQIAKNCRTSVEMIEKHYAAHIKTLLDATLINVRKPKKSQKAKTKPDDTDEDGDL